MTRTLFVLLMLIFSAAAAFADGGGPLHPPPGDPGFNRDSEYFCDYGYQCAPPSYGYVAAPRPIFIVRLRAGGFWYWRNNNWNMYRPPYPGVMPYMGVRRYVVPSQY